MKKKTAIIIGAGPAGLTAAYELLKKTTIQPIVIEKSNTFGGISRTINYKGNRIDIGGHRFFSKSDRIMKWWQEILPIQAYAGDSFTITYHNKKKQLNMSAEGPDPAIIDNVLLIRKRKSRILFNRTFFDYPLRINPETIKKLGLWQTLLMGISYVKSVLRPIKNEQTLEDFLINRFGRALYKTFFKTYTEKVWGVPCNQINAEWGAQRIKGLSITKALVHFIKQYLPQKASIEQKNVETSLIEYFLYPKFGPGHMWQEVAKKIENMGGIIHLNTTATKFLHHGNAIHSVITNNTVNNGELTFEADYVFSTMPINELMRSLDPQPSQNFLTISEGLMYRDFITVGILARRLMSPHTHLDDNWIYIQEPDVLVGRLQIFNNWSPYMVNDHTTVWLGLEYFCFKDDELWQKSDTALIELAKHELYKLGLINKHDILDATVIRMEKTYPAYFGSYDQFPELRSYLDSIQNLFLIGRNGMHRYNNQDHSMLTAMQAVDVILNNSHDKESIWHINTEQEYHETKHV